MKTVFLSDTHLTGRNNKVQKNLLNFLEELIEGRSSCKPVLQTLDGVSRVVILGDFFDFWFSQGEIIYPGFIPVIDTIKKLNKVGIKIIICEGNHDYFLRDYFTVHLGIEVYPEWATIQMGEYVTLMSHGDTVDKDDIGYLALRLLLRSSIAYKIQKTIPLSIIWNIALSFSKLSRASHHKKRLANVMYRYSLDKFKEGYDAVILGHCHQAELKKIEQSGRKKVFVTLGDWETEGLFLLYDEDGEFSLNRFRIGEC